MVFVPLFDIVMAGVSVGAAASMVDWIPMHQS